MVPHVVEGGHLRQAAVASPGVVARQPVVTTSLYVEGHEVKAVARPVLEQVVLDLTGEESVHLGQNASLSSVATLLTTTTATTATTTTFV